MSKPLIRLAERLSQVFKVEDGQLREETSAEAEDQTPRSTPDIKAGQS